MKNKLNETNEKLENIESKLIQEQNTNKTLKNTLFVPKEKMKFTFKSEINIHIDKLSKFLDYLQENDFLYNPTIISSKNENTHYIFYTAIRPVNYQQENESYSLVLLLNKFLEKEKN